MMSETQFYKVRNEVYSFMIDSKMKKLSFEEFHDGIEEIRVRNDVSAFEMNVLIELIVDAIGGTVQNG